MRFHSLTSRFLFTLLLATAVPFLLFGWFVRGEVLGQLEQQARASLPKLAGDAAERIRRRLDEIYTRCGLLRNAATEVMLEGGDDWRLRRTLVRRTLDLAPGMWSSFDLVLLVDGQGAVRGYFPNPGLDPKTKSARDLLRRTSVAGEDWFERISTGARGKIWRDRHLSPLLHRTLDQRFRDPADYSLALAISVPTSVKNVYGAVYALVRWQEVQKILDETVRPLREGRLASAAMFLCDAAGTYLAHTERRRYSGRLQAPELLAPLAQSAALLRDGVENRGDVAFVDDDGERWAGFAAVQIPPDLRWFLCLHVGTANLFKASRDFGRILLIIAGVIALFLIVWAMVASRAIVRPVRRLADATEAVAHGDLSARVPARGSHELADLGRSFNHMAEDLASSREQLKHAERQAAWAEMARQVAHEIKNPLTPMRMSAQLLRKARREDRGRVEELTERLTKTVLDQTEALDRIASDFRQLAGPPVREVDRIAADEILRDAQLHLAALAADGRTEMRFRPGAEGAMIEVDRQEMRRVFLNLVGNAMAAGENGVKIEISSAASDRRVVFRVRDDGPGVGQEQRGKLFEPYFTTKSSGTGLGLAICQRILQAHKGQILLESSAPGCTVFRLELPRAPDGGGAPGKCVTET